MNMDLRKIGFLWVLAWFTGGTVVAGVGWEFDVSGDLQGWRPTNQLAAGEVRDGALMALTVGEDPFWESPSFSAPADAYGSILVRMKVEAAEGGPRAQPSFVQVFWRTDAYPGDREEASANLAILRDSQWHDYEIPVGANPEWKGEITGLRLDPCNLAEVRVSIDAVRLLPPVKTASAAAFLAGEPSNATEWNFREGGGLQGWRPNGKMAACEVREGALTVLAIDADPFMESPPLRLPAGEFGAVCVRMKLEAASGGPVAGETIAQIYWGTDAFPGFREQTSVKFGTTGDGQWHDYQVPTAVHGDWKGGITGLRLDPCSSPDVRVSIESIRCVPMSQATEWVFRDAGDMLGWRPNGDIGNCTVKDGVLTALTTGGDPHWESPPFRAPSDAYATVRVRMKLESKDGSKYIADQTPAQLFWRTDASPGFNEEASEAFETYGSGKWEDYEIVVSAHSEWKGDVIGLRFDPCQTPDIRVSIESIRLEPAGKNPHGKKKH